MATQASDTVPSTHATTAEDVLENEGHFVSGDGHEARPASADAPRPAFSRQWQTERPQATTKASLLGNPKLTRHATNISALNVALWNSNNDDQDSTTSSSSSSDEDDDDTEGRKKQGKQGQGKRNRGYSRFNVGNEDFHTRGRVRKDGRLTISVNETNNRGYLAKALGATFQHFGPSATDEMTSTRPTEPGRTDYSRASSESTIAADIPRPRLSIVVMVIGSRGDIQPFLKIGKGLKEYGHRVRIATHPAFKEFVEKDSGLEFFSVGGDPAELMAFMVKNPGMIPTMETLKKGEVGRRRDQMAEMFEGFWRACINATDDEKDQANLKMMGKKAPFIADAIIANPPSFAHIHCAERLGIPLHLMFTFPYTPTQAFPHPLANIKRSNVDPGYANFMSYPLVEMMTWQGLGDLINNFRVKTLGLEPVSTLWAPGQLYRLHVPYTYLWSPGLIPKPKDWGPEIDIAGFVFLDLASSFTPPKDLVNFLDAGEPPVYIGFGSIVVDDPDKFTKMIFEAVKKAGVRALVSKGWGGLGDDDNTPDNIFMLENTPHDWLFPKVSAVVHHGGAGTTAIGLKSSRPTFIVPFFGDQQFWGAMIGESGAGAKPVPYKELTADKLAEGIKQCLTDEARQGAEKIAKDIEAEGDGAKNAVTSFHRSLVLRGQRSMRCSILEDRVAVWSLKNTNLRLSALAAELLVTKKKLSWKQLRLIRHSEWNDMSGPGEPLSGTATALMGTVTGIATGIGSVPFRIAKNTKKRARHEEKKQRKSEEASRKKNTKRMANSGKENQKATTNGKYANESKPTQPENQQDDGRDECKKSNQDPAGTANVEATRSRGASSATGEPGMGKHTVQGEPIREKRNAQSEQRQQNDDDDDDDACSDLSDDPQGNIAEEMAHDIGSGVGKTAKAIAEAPMDLSLAIAQGFHNAPRLYGDSTVRRPTRITGIKSGLKAAGEEFTYGIYDGVTGLVSQPYNGARNNGPIGFVKGVGMGLTGFVLKDLAAIFGPFGYTFKGVHKELLKHKQPTNFIRKARIREGQLDFQELDEKRQQEAMEATYHGWSVVQQVWAVMEEKRTKGLGGRLKVMRERKTWRANGAFENVAMAERALEARRKGDSLEGVFAQQREELEAAQRPRKTVAQDLEEGGGDEVEADKQHVQKNGWVRPPTKDVPDFAKGT